MTAQERLDAILDKWNELVYISNETPATPEEVIRLEDALAAFAVALWLLKKRTT